MTTLVEHTPLFALRLRARFDGSEPSTWCDRPLPSRIGQSSQEGTLSVVKVGPGEWLVLERQKQVDVPAAGSGNDIAVFDEGGAWRLLRLEGDTARDLVAQFCPIDLQAMDETSGFATQLGGHPVIVFPRSGDVIEVLVRRSYTASLMALISDAILRTP